MGWSCATYAVISVLLIMGVAGGVAMTFVANESKLDRMHCIVYPGVTAVVEVWRHGERWVRLSSYVPPQS